MKQFIVSISARSQTIDLTEITRLMGLDPTSGTGRGELNMLGTACYLYHDWSIASDAEDEGSMELQGAWLIESLSKVSPEVIDLASSGSLEVSIGVGIMYDTYTTSVRLAPDLVCLASRIGAGFEVSSYPTNFDGPKV